MFWFRSIFIPNLQTSASLRRGLGYYHCLPFRLSSDGHTDKDIVLKWKNSSIQIGNKEMAQFLVGEATLSTEVTTFTTGKIVSSDITSQAMLSCELAGNELVDG